MVLFQDTETKEQLYCNMQMQAVEAGTCVLYYSIGIEDSQDILQRLLELLPFVGPE